MRTVRLWQAELHQTASGMGAIEPLLESKLNTYPLRNESGQTFAFEIDSFLVTQRFLAKVLQRVPGASEVKVRRLFRRPFDIQATFVFEGRRFIVWEPFADSSRYWIGPENCSEAAIDVSEIEEAFKASKRLCR